MKGKPNRKSVEDNIDAIITAWRNHTPQRKLAEQYQCAPNTLRNIIKQKIGPRPYNRIRLANHHAAHKGNITPAMIPGIVTAFRGGTPLTALCRQYHCNNTTMRKAIVPYIDDAEYQQLRRRFLTRGGKKTRFQKGFEPWNKNVKGIHLSPQSEFKKGSLPANHKEVGQISIRKHRGISRRMIKVSGIKHGAHKWIPYTTWLWQQTYGPVPEGFFVIHKDGKTLHDAIDNYRLVTHAEHLRLNTARDPEATRKRKSKSMKKAWAKRKRDAAAIEAARVRRQKREAAELRRAAMLEHRNRQQQAAQLRTGRSQVKQAILLRTAAGSCFLDVLRLRDDLRRRGPAGGLPEMRHRCLRKMPHPPKTGNLM
ncbi:MAG: HNH endonuclease [Phycisphaerae bacterium]|nr:HNH endonuclease [Phycisphaerae bacterium]